jgi:Malonyl-CoA decarboxylase C-terminal domain/Malonyl-CoA decarboxylase N-terminal domain
LDFSPTKPRLAAERYLADGTAEAAAALAQAADPPGQELLRRMNMRPGRTSALIAMRSEVNALLRDEPELKLVDADLQHLFASWFNRGFLELRRIDWQAAATVLEKLIAYEAVHEIKGWADLWRRPAPDRPCFAFFRPALPGEPLIFVEVAVVQGLAPSVPPLVSHRCFRRAGAGRACRHRDLLFDLQLPGWPARRIVWQCSDQASVRGAAHGVPAAEALLDALTGASLPLLRLYAEYRMRPNNDLGAIDPVPAFTGWSGSTGSATPHYVRSRSPLASSSTIFMTPTASRTTTKLSYVTGPSCTRRRWQRCWKQEPARVTAAREQGVTRN